jgi:hypothetical protein
MWEQLERMHAVFWYAPEVFEEAAGLGLRHRDPVAELFPGRPTPLGAAGLGLVARTAGRTLLASNATPPWPGELHRTLWLAINVLREHRRDGHPRAAGGRAGPVWGTGATRHHRRRARETFASRG